MTLATLPAGLDAADAEDLAHISKLGNISVLVVEDDLAQQKILRELFDRANEKNQGAIHFEVTMVGTGNAAISLLCELDAPRFHLILLDLLLPDKNGYELLPEIRELVGHDVAIVCASAHSQLSLVQLCVRRGADAFFVKPLGCEDVQHIWQFVKDMPEGSFKDDVDQARSFKDGEKSFANDDAGSSVLAQAMDSASSSPPPLSGQQAAAERAAELAAVTHPVCAAASSLAAADITDVLVCGGCAPPASASSSRTSVNMAEAVRENIALISIGHNPTSDDVPTRPPRPESLGANLSSVLARAAEREAQARSTSAAAGARSVSASQQSSLSGSAQTSGHNSAQTSGHNSRSASCEESLATAEGRVAQASPLQSGVSLTAQVRPRVVVGGSRTAGIERTLTNASAASAERSSAQSVGTAGSAAGSDTSGGVSRMYTPESPNEEDAQVAADCKQQ